MLTRKIYRLRGAEQMLQRGFKTLGVVSPAINGNINYQLQKRTSKTPLFPINALQCRGMFEFLNQAWNRIDQDRIKEVGPDRTCAEWVLRCSGSVRFAGREAWSANYNSLAANTGPVKLEAIDFSNSCVTNQGFAHLMNLKHLRSVKLSGNHDVSDTALQMLNNVKDTLESLQISGCSGITDNGIKKLTELPHLRELYLSDLPNVKNMQSTVEYLRNNMKECEIHTTSDDGDRSGGSGAQQATEHQAGKRK